MSWPKNIREWVEAGTDGRNWVSSFRKVPPAITIAGQWFDFSGAAGSPVPNYYASSPLIAATLDSSKGIYLGPAPSSSKRYLRQLMVMNGAAGVNTVTSRNLALYLLDYLLYYPFIDMDAVAEAQEMDNTVSLPRYATGRGVQMILVAQAPTVGGGQFTVTYTNQDGTSGRVTPLHFCAAAQPTGALVSSTTAASGVHPFLTLQSGDTGVRSVQSINFSVANGGLAVIALVKPIQTILSREESRRTTAGTLESFGSAKEIESIRQRVGAEELLDGAYLSFIGQTVGGTIAGMQLVGTIETVWS